MSDHRHEAYDIYGIATSGDLSHLESAVQGAVQDLRHDLNAAVARIRDLERELEQAKLKIFDLAQDIATLSGGAS